MESSRRLYEVPEKINKLWALQGKSALFIASVLKARRQQNNAFIFQREMNSNVKFSSQSIN